MLFDVKIVCALIAFIWSALTVANDYNHAKAVFMTDAVASHGAQCLDGSPGLFYIAIGAEVRKYLIYFQGGGWCSGYQQSMGKGFDSCWHRRNSGSMGSTTNDPLSMDLNNTFGMGLNATLNPTMWNWTHVYVRYCCGGSFSGDRTDAVVVANQSMYFRGKRILDALLSTLITDYALAKATDIVISGGSAGGEATFLHTNYIANYVKSYNAEIKMVSLPNVGFFLDYNGYEGDTNYSNGMQWIFDNMNVSSSIVDSNCLQNANLTQEQCMFPQNIAGDNEIATFVFNSQYDAWQVYNILGSMDVGLIDGYGTNFTRLLMNNYMARNDKNGGMFAAFINSCCYHDGDTNTYWYDLVIDGMSAAYAFDAFYRGLDDEQQKTTEKLFCFQNVTYPCSNYYQHR